MSDDGGYAGSPYEEYDEYFDDEPSLDLADDLAQHAAYSPVWQDTPLGELDVYHSDWEYYSDDYYDDDPKLLALNTLDGIVSRSSGQHEGLPLKKGRKRKLDEVRDNTEAYLQTKALKDSIKGTVWAKQQPDLTAIFRKGEQAKVSLLTNWRDLFGNQDRTMPLRGQSQMYLDDSWANDMSLADMGLHSQREQQNIPDQSIAEDDDESLASENDYATSDEAIEVVGMYHLPLDDASDPPNRAPNLIDIADVSQKQKTSVGAKTKQSSGHDDDEDHYQGPRRKRRKQRILPSPPASTESTSLRTPTELKSNADELSKGPSAQVPSETVSLKKKRKLSIDDEDQEAKLEQTNKRSRSRQIDPSNSKSTQEQPPTKTSLPPRRARRLKREAG